MNAPPGLYFVHAAVAPPTRVRVGYPAAALPRDLARAFGPLGDLAITFAFDVERYGEGLLAHPRVSRSGDGAEWTLTCTDEETHGILSAVR